jgi:hypothetical protein
VTAYWTVGETWKVIEENFTSAKRACTIISRIALTTTKKGDLSVAEYVNKMCVLCDELATADKPIDDDVLISYRSIDLDYEYNSVVTTLLTKEVLTVGYVYSQLLHFEQRLALQTSGEHYSMAATLPMEGVGCGGGGRLQSTSRGIGRSAGRFSTGHGNFNS